MGILTDFLVQDLTSIALLQPVTARAHRWVETNLPKDALRFNGAVVVEHRYVEAIFNGITTDGLTIQ